MSKKSYNKYIENIINNIYKELYKNSIPIGDWDILYKKYHGTEVKFWEKYYCPRNIQHEIIWNILKKQKHLTHFVKFNIKNRILKKHCPTHKTKK